MKNLFLKAEFKYLGRKLRFRAPFKISYLKEVRDYVGTMNKKSTMYKILDDYISKRNGKEFIKNGKVWLSALGVEMFIQLIEKFKDSGKWEDSINA